MKHTLLPFTGLLAILLLPGCCCIQKESAPKSGAIELFDGKSLAEWKFVAAEQNTWAVREGVLTCTGDPVGFTYKDRQFTNFRMVVEYRWPTKPGNSGIFSRITDTKTALPQCVEVQLMNKSAGDVLTLQGKPMSTNQARSFEVKKHALAGDIVGVRKTVDAEKPAGEWNHVEILAQGPVYTVWVNGQKVNEASGIDTRPGYVGLQSEGGQIEFRKATITPLP